MIWELYIAGIMLAAIVAYALLGGADFGGGIWDLFATGPRARDQRQVIAKAIGPIWEANHVWLIAVIVLLFSCFPLAYATISNALHIPLSLMLLGIVLRGSAFVFRSYDTQRTAVFEGWSRVFAVASVLAPFMLGVSLGAASSGRIRLDATGQVATGFVHGWWAPFPLAVGAFVLAVFAFLAAVYLTLETDDPDLQDGFRARALGTAPVVTALAWLVFWLAGDDAVHLREGLWGSWWSWPFQAVTAALGGVLLWALWTRRYRIARAVAMVQVGALVCGYGAAQFPYIVAPDVTFYNAAAPDAVLEVVAFGMTGGLALLLPVYAWMLRVFKRGTAEAAD
ncbi:MAG: cytochrome d ubiquinol oxidase subunit II [Alphaproteobacteria bacterium]|nr:cytochrome d ubiquinol oxidase subunit II [Alphaproteobacteria bacterium]